MPKYYCDYCDTYLTHDSPSVRKTHNGGRRHKDTVRLYYVNWLERQAQTMMTHGMPPGMVRPMGPGLLAAPGMMPPVPPPGMVMPPMGMGMPPPRPGMMPPGVPIPPPMAPPNATLIPGSQPPRPTGSIPAMPPAMTPN